MRGILKGDHLLGREGKGGEDGEVEFRVRLGARDLVRRADRVERLGESKMGEVTNHPLPRRARGKAELEVKPVSAFQVVGHAGEDRFLGDQLGLPPLLLTVEGGAVDRALEALLQAVARVERVGKTADRVEPQAQRELAPATREDLPPGEEGRGLRIEDQAVEIEDESLHHHACRPLLQGLPLP